MFEHLTKYSKIIVMGPQHSGSTIAAKMIVMDTRYEYIDEGDFNVQEIDKFEKLFKKDKIVVQAP